MCIGLKPPYRRGEQPKNAETVEHVFPRRILRFEKHSDDWLLRNQVIACDGCNNRKAEMHPLNWLLVMPDYGVGDLAALLVELGTPRRRVDKWLARRPSEAPGSEQAA